MELVHEAVIERSEVFQAFRVGFLKPLKEKNLCAGVELFKKMAELSHRITTCRHTEYVVDQAFHELLGDILAGEVAFRKLSRS